MANYFEALNAPQSEAVLHTEGPLIVLAGAGSGKTRMLTSRICHLIEGCGVAPHEVLAVTFTNKASREMRERIQHGLAGSRYLSSPEVGTFHSVCLRLIRSELQASPFIRNFSIYDDSDQLTLIKEVFKLLQMDDKATSPKAIQAAINRLKCDAIEPHELEVEPHDVFQRNLEKVYKLYQKRMIESQAIDFGEIICLAYRILRDFPEIRHRYQARFRYVLVDEYQDTNRAQYLFISMLSSPKNGGLGNLCVVGDEDQSIYQWRGADIRNILDFEQDYPGAKLIKLEQNYRSTQTIVNAASGLIQNNTERRPKVLFTENPVGVPIERVGFSDERAEAEAVIREVGRLSASEHLNLNEVAIFYRTHAQSRQFEEFLRRDKIPYEIYGGLRFYDRKEIKDVLAYLQVLLNPKDSISLKRILNVPPRGIGKTTVERLEALQTGSLYESIEKALQEPTDLGAAAIRKLEGFFKQLQNWISGWTKLPLTQLYYQLLDDTQYIQLLKQEGTEEAQARIENLEEFETVLQEFEEKALGHVPTPDRDKKYPELLPQFLEESTLATDTLGKNDEPVPSVQLMTLHSSKGLEFPVVFMVGMEETLFPSIQGWEANDDAEVQEERRLCYVGMTRARKRLIMTHAQVRRIWGQTHYHEPSRFFGEIPEDFIEYKDFRLRAGSSNGSGATVAVHHPFQGRTIEHPEYGNGRVVQVEADGLNSRILVQFGASSTRKFLLRFVEQFIV